MEILLIRHGQSEGDILHVHEGRADFTMTDLGIEQAKKMAKRVKEEFPPEFIWASTLKRASVTASILAEEIGCGIQYLDELREINNGELAGRPEHEGPHLRDLQPYEKLGGNGESRIEFRARAEHVFSMIKDKSESYDRIAIVCHGVMISRLLESFLHLPVIGDVYFRTGDTGIHLLEYSERGRLVRFLNSTGHVE